MVDVKNEKPSPGLESFAIEFLNDRLTELEEMKKCVAASELGPIGRMAHKWKGFCAPYGFNHLETLSESLERMVSELNFDESSNIVSQISEYLELKEQLLKKSE